jgi:DNA-binding NtrC family response regulator
MGGLCLLYARHFRELPAAVSFDALPLTLGRSRSSALMLDESAVSRAHARIEKRGTDYVVLDLDSRNGTFVNGERIRERRLVDGDVLRVGDSLFKYVAQDIDGYARHRIDGAVLGKNGFELRPNDAELVGGYQIHVLLDRAERIARTSLSVVLHGESGAGKELVARRIHEESGRRGPFVAVNCAALPPNLIESELFGYRKGAFSGALQNKVGLIAAASGGTLFLDEIGDMAMEAQAKLLRVLQESEVHPVGALSPERVDLRVVCASHRDLSQLVEHGGFRGDLMARLKQATLSLPPLRSRPEDIYGLVRRVLEREGRPEVDVDFSFMHALIAYPWPYNVRELVSAVRVVSTLCRGGVLEARDLPDHITTRSQRRSPGLPDAEAESAPARQSGPRPRSAASKPPSEAELRALCERTLGNVSALGRELGKDRVQIHRWLKLYGIDLSQYRGAP